MFLSAKEVKMRREQSAKELIINHYNDRVSKRNSSLIINDYKDSKRNKKGYSPELARARADYLCEKLNSPQSMNFYLKCAWNLTDICIDRILAVALKKDMPAKYFAVAASNEMR